MNSLSDKIQTVKKILESGSKKSDSYLSGFWKDILEDRNNFPNSENLTNFLSNDSSYGYGNNREKDTSEKYRRFVESIIPETPLDFLVKFTDPAFGNPVRFKYKNVFSSMVFLQNIPTTYRINKLPLKRGLRVLEIGAGFGAVAYQLNQILDIKKYTIVDLPESLFLSYFYLSENTKRPVAFSDNEKIENGFEFALPNQMDKIDYEFNLIINTASMGEMDFSMVETYKKVINEKLSPEGFFFSINTHGKAGVKNPNQYLIDGMKLYSIEPWVRRSHNHIFNKLHYEIVQSKTDGEEITRELRDEVDYKGRLMNLGVRLPLDESTRLYEKGLKSYMQGEVKQALKYLSEALNKGIDGFARTVSIFILTVHDWRTFFGFPDKRMKEEMFKQTPIQIEEINSYISSPLALYRSKKSLKKWLKREITW
jgi:putative sugar O-methyltransferase